MGRIFIRREEEKEHQWHVPFLSKPYGEPDGEIPSKSEDVYFELEDHRIVEGQIVVESSGFYTLYDNNWQGWSEIRRWKFR